MIVNRVREIIASGMSIPKPDAKADFKIKGWGKRRNSPALIYMIPNDKTPEKQYQKGIIEQEFKLIILGLRTWGCQSWQQDYIWI